MAGRMENWIAYQQRHLSPVAFEAWLAGDVKVLSWLAKQAGTSQVERNLDRFQRDFMKRVMGPALQKASDYLAGVEKSSTPSLSGLLRQAIGSTKVRLYEATFCGWVASGPRRGFGRAIATKTKTGRWKKKRTRISKKRGIEELALSEVSGSESVMFKNPAAYAQYLRHGRHAIFRPKKARAFPITAKGGATFFRLRVGAAAPRDFMAPAAAAADQAAARATEEMNARLQTLTKN